jgi:hypothetical protein
MELGHSSLTNLLIRTYCKKNPQQTYINKLENYQDKQIWKNQLKFQYRNLASQHKKPVLYICPPSITNSKIMQDSCLINTKHCYNHEENKTKFIHMQTPKQH